MLLVSAHKAAKSRENMSFSQAPHVFSARFHGFAAFFALKVIPQYCTAHLLLRTISHAISARALENGGFFFTAGPRSLASAYCSWVSGTVMIAAHHFTASQEF